GDQALVRVELVLRGEEERPVPRERTVTVEGASFRGGDGADDAPVHEVDLAAARALLLEDHTTPRRGGVGREAVPEEIHRHGARARVVEVEEREQVRGAAGVLVEEAPVTEHRAAAARGRARAAERRERSGLEGYRQRALEHGPAAQHERAVADHVLPVFPLRHPGSKYAPAAPLVPGAKRAVPTCCSGLTSKLRGVTSA